MPLSAAVAAAAVDVAVVPADEAVDAVAAAAADAAPPIGDVGLVGASVHAAVAAAHARPSQARTILSFIVRLLGPPAVDRIRGRRLGGRYCSTVPRSLRLPDLAPNRLSLARKALECQGVPLLDLAGSNPTTSGLDYPGDLLAGLADPAGLRYAPDPRGLAPARQAVCDQLGRQGLVVEPDRVVLTASTSEAYAFLFKVACEPGDDVLVPVPSYPLFEHLSRLEGVRAVPYPLDRHGGWAYDPGAVAAHLTPRTRAVIVVSPNNPTGTVVSAAQARALSDVCSARDVLLIADEVFADYRVDGGAAGPGSILGVTSCLAVSLGGLSKAVGLPQLKLAWMAIGGPAAMAEDLVSRLELVADTFLSVGTPIQLALPALLARGAPIRDGIRRRIAANLALARHRLAAAPSLQLLEPHGGWTAVLRVPATRSEEALALDILEREHVVVQPGYFYDFPHEAFLVVSLITEPRSFAQGLDRIVAAATAESDKMAAGRRPDEHR
jgi:alanine-synthesizing transaminase